MSDESKEMQREKGSNTSSNNSSNNRQLSLTSFEPPSDMIDVNDSAATVAVSSSTTPAILIESDSFASRGEGSATAASGQASGSQLEMQGAAAIDSRMSGESSSSSSSAMAERMSQYIPTVVGHKRILNSAASGIADVIASDRSSKNLKSRGTSPVRVSPVAHVATSMFPSLSFCTSSQLQLRTQALADLRVYSASLSAELIAFQSELTKLQADKEKYEEQYDQLMNDVDRARIKHIDELVKQLLFHQSKEEANRITDATYEKPFFLFRALVDTMEDCMRVMLRDDRNQDVIVWRYEWLLQTAPTLTALLSWLTSAAPLVDFQFFCGLYLATHFMQFATSASDMVPISQYLWSMIETPVMRFISFPLLSKSMACGLDPTHPYYRRGTAIDHARQFIHSEGDNITTRWTEAQENGEVNDTELYVGSSCALTNFLCSYAPGCKSIQECKSLGSAAREPTQMQQQQLKLRFVRALVEAWHQHSLAVRKEIQRADIMIPDLANITAEYIGLDASNSK